MTSLSKPPTFRIRNAYALEHVQRAVYNAGIAACAQALTNIGRTPALRRSPRHPDGLYGQLTRWRAKQPERFSGPIALQRPALRQAHEASQRVGTVHAATAQRLLDEGRDAHPEHNPAAWDALSAQEKRGV